MELTPELRALVDDRLRQVCAAQPALRVRVEHDAVFLDSLRRVLLVSDYAADRLCVDAGVLDTVESEPPPLQLEPDDEARWPEQLRRYRHACSVRLIWRDVNNLDRIDDTLAASTRLADHCCEQALRAIEQDFAQRHGLARAADGTAQRLVVFGLGKQGGGELNFSSDIDLVFAYAEAGRSDGAAPLENENYFQRIGRRLIQLLGEITEDGFGFRVDMRLRPFGASGRLALSFAALEHYFQREGRDWERYAWIKARPVAGDIGAGEQMLQTLRPFVYRRYLDYGAFEGLREMKTLIEAEVQRRDLADHLKLGPGGIREIEFIVQLQQLIRAGREPELRVRGLLPALAQLRTQGYLPPGSADALAEDYRFLRRLENRLQMLREEQTHDLPADAMTRARLALGLGYRDWNALDAAVASHRERVAAEFARVFEARTRGRRATDALVEYWRQIEHEPDATALVDAGFQQAETLHAKLLEFAASAAVLGRSARARARLDRVLPTLLGAAARSAQPDHAAERALELVNAVLRRSSYLALLDEQPSALARLIEVMAASAWMAERVSAHPMLLDDLLDSRIDEVTLRREDLGDALTRALTNVADDDFEARLLALNEFRQSQNFRIALATVLRQQPATLGTRQLAWVAEAVVAEALSMVFEDLVRSHGRLPDGAGLAMLAYGSFGAQELGFGSDLDLVFLFDADAASADSDGERPLEASRYHARAVQKLIALLATLTPAGRLYEVDLRLRPDGATGLLVSTLQSFAAYQRSRAWTWEHQALVRARFVAGDGRVGRAFDAIREGALAQPRDAAQVREDVSRMRGRMRAELDRTGNGRFDLKQGAGGLVDLEFMLQAGVLTLAATHPALTRTVGTPELIRALTDAGWLTQDECVAVTAAHAELLARSLTCTLDARPRLVPENAAIDDARSVILALQQRLGLVPLRIDPVSAATDDAE